MHPTRSVYIFGLFLQIVVVTLLANLIKRENALSLFSSSCIYYYLTFYLKLVYYNNRHRPTRHVAFFSHWVHDMLESSERIFIFLYFYFERFKCRHETSEI